MELLAIGIISFAVMLAYAIYLKFNYFKHWAICLDSSPSGSISHTTYEYEIIEAGEKRTYVSRGTALFYPKKGKKYRVLIHKRNYNKVVGYSAYVGDVILMSILLACILDNIISMYM